MEKLYRSWMTPIKDPHFDKAGSSVLQRTCNFPDSWEVRLKNVMLFATVSSDHSNREIRRGRKSFSVSLYTSDMKQLIVWFSEVWQNLGKSLIVSVRALA